MLNYNEIIQLLEENGYEPSFSLAEKVRNGELKLEHKKEEVVNECMDTPDKLLGEPIKKPFPTKKKVIKEQKVYRSHTDEYLKGTLTENYNLKLSEVEQLSEDAKVETVKALVSQVLSAVSEKLNSIDTSIADKSRGDVKALKNLQSLQTAITQLEALLERSDSVTPQCQEYLGIIIKSILYLNQYSMVFKDAYRNKKTLLILKYQSIILSIISSVSYLISAIIDLTNSDVQVKDNIVIEEIAPIKSLREFVKSVDSGEFKIISKDLNILREFYTEVPVETMSKLVEANDIVNMVIDGVKNIYNNITSNGKAMNTIYKATGVIVLLFSLRDALYSLYRMRTKVSEMVSGIESFANINFGSSLKNLLSFASKFKTDAEAASDMGKREIEDEDRRLSTKVRAIQAAPVIAAPTNDNFIDELPVDNKPADNSGEDVFNFNF